MPLVLIGTGRSHTHKTHNQLLVAHLYIYGQQRCSFDTIVANSIYVPFLTTSLRYACAVANFGSSFAIWPVNYFNQLASRTVFDVPVANITECGAPLQGIVDGSTEALG
jgi:hypothetical protein